MSSDKLQISWICNKTRGCDIGPYGPIGSFDPIEKLNKIMEESRDWKTNDIIYFWYGRKSKFEYVNDSFTLDIKEI